MLAPVLIDNLATTEPVTGNTPETRPENRAFYPALDGLRAVAFLMVFLQHYYAMPWGWTGVNIFFVLSGFLITGILFDSRDDPHRARNFYVRRTLRIFPLYYAIVFALLLAEPIMHWQWSRAWIAWPLYLGNLLRAWSPRAGMAGSTLQIAANGWLESPRFPQLGLSLGHFWSLCVEEQFYLIWPWVVFWIRSRRTLLWVCGSVVLADVVLRFVGQSFLPAWMIHQDVLHSFTPFAFGSLLLGGWVGLMWRGPYRDRLVWAGRILLSVGAVVALIYFVHVRYYMHPGRWPNYPYPTWILTIGIPFANLLSISLLLCILYPRGILYRLFSLAPLRWLGRLSYGAYVFHDIFHTVLMYSMNVLSANLALRYGGGFVRLQHYQTQIYPLFVFALTLVLASLSFRYLESPFLNLKEKWTIRTSTSHR
jgi:peptidoglycan/LPS O-acetylase OafA/YrhL